MPQFAVLIYSDDSAHAPGATAENSEDVAACDEHAEELTTAAVMTAAWALTPRSFATTIRSDGTTDGPYLGTSQVVAGFYILEASDLDTALATAATNPVIQQGGGVEVRPVHSGGFVDQA